MRENIFVNFGKFIFLADFITLDIEEGSVILLILGHPFLAKGRAMINVQKFRLIFRLDEEEQTIKVFKAFRFHSEPNSYM